LASEMRSGDDGRRVGTASPWGFDAAADRGQSYAELVGILRQLQDLVACGQPTESRARRAHDHLGQAVALLEEFKEQPGGLNVRGDISGRDDPLIVPVGMVRWNADSAEGTAQFSPFHHGGGGGVHGGVIALLFDDFIGRLANYQQITRTAYIHVNYRAVCPIGRNLVIRAHVVRREGRKMFLSGALADNDSVIADCEGLWVVLPENRTHDRVLLAAVRRLGQILVIWSRSPDGDDPAAIARRPRIAALGQFTVTKPVSAPSPAT
jgi:acyl-coenzyme A thioesterase PaaI-like protein